MTDRPPIAPDPDADETIDGLEADETIDGTDLLAQVRAELASPRPVSEIETPTRPRFARTPDRADGIEGPTSGRPAADQPDEDVELTLGADDFAQHRPSRPPSPPAAGTPSSLQPPTRSQPPTRWQPPAPPAPAATRRSAGRVQILAIVIAVVIGLLTTAMIWRQVDASDADTTQSSPVLGSPVLGSPVLGSPVLGSPVLGSPVHAESDRDHGA